MIKSVRTDREKICVLMKALFCRNTLCIARKSAKIRAQIFRETPQAIYSVFTKGEPNRGVCVVLWSVNPKLKTGVRYMNEMVNWFLHGTVKQCCRRTRTSDWQVFSLVNWITGNCIAPMAQLLKLGLLCYAQNRCFSTFVLLNYPTQHENGLAADF